MSKTRSRSSRQIKRPNGARSDGRVRFAVVGLGWIAQESVLPAFANAGNTRLTALVSNDPVKLSTLSKKYHVPHTYSYEQYEECLHSNEVDAVYIALPNDMHCEYTVRAARAGVHVLCEKPMAVTEHECDRMIEETAANNVQLMIAYRLHFDESHLEALKEIRARKLGQVRLFDSIFTMPVMDPDNIRLQAERGGGTLYDIGIYCINHARSVFGSEPYEVFASSVRGGDDRFMEVDEMTSALMRFPGERLASFTVSFGVHKMSVTQVLGTKGSLRFDPAYNHAGPLKQWTRFAGKERSRTFADHDQFSPQLIYFSDCVLSGRGAEPSGCEGLADVRIIRALLESARQNRPLKLREFDPNERPSPAKQMRRPPVAKPELIHAESPH